MRDMPSCASVLVLCGERITPDDLNVTRLLDFFGLPWKMVRADDENIEGPDGPYAIVTSADCMAGMVQEVPGSGQSLPPWVMKADAAYVYGFRVNDRSTKLLRFLTGNPQAKIRTIGTHETLVTIARDLPEMCGPMSGMRVPITPQTQECVCEMPQEDGASQRIVRTEDGELFFSVDRAGVRFYLNACSGTVDISALSTQYFDVKKSFCEAVPFIFYLRAAFFDAFSCQPETSACLIVDDPPLKERYGFLEFDKVLELMAHHNFTTTIAFIPWNWRRTDPGTLNLFRNHAERLSLVLHGCDHTSGEFGVQSSAILNRKIQTSIQRMEHFRRRASFSAERVMVFPQGRFSAESGRALKLNGFVAAVNTEVAPAQTDANETTIADLWSIAIMRYGGFPIFTRRYLSHGIENFAFDALLGKPCLIAAHHDVFRDHARDLVDFIGRLNSLSWNLAWRPLGDAIRRTFIARRLNDGTRAVQMFAGSLTLEHPGVEGHKTLLLKTEADPACIEAVCVNEAPVEFNVRNGYLRAWLTTPPGETVFVRVVYRNDFGAIPDLDVSRINIGVAAKRYLSEFRDNYLSRSDRLSQGANWLVHRMH
ncbi:MAG TPA: hypothetical protein VHD76_13470 [Bryobacteraceae bacterium]|nr:hypothetical protein [Bryobacteraceae bacterium]